MTGEYETAPRLFISYSWSSADHQAWVVEFAGQLRHQGIDVILDKWHLKPGHDANAFMEKMVTDKTVTKVILICDEVYAKKSDGRKGGAGTEAQIITPELYAEREQDKFVAVVRENDEHGKAYLPTYYGSRIYIDLSSPATYAQEFERVVRWAWDAPWDVPPEIGAKPAFLNSKSLAGKPADLGSRRIIEAMRNGSAHASAAAGEFLGSSDTIFEKFRLASAQVIGENYDDVVVDNVDKFVPYRNEFISLFSAIAQYQPTLEMVGIVHRFFERLIPYLHPPTNASSYSDVDQDNYQFIVHELFLYWMATLLKYERFDAASTVIDDQYYWNSRRRPDETMHNFTIFREYAKTFDIRSERLKLKRTSIRADMLKERNEGTGIDFAYVLCADFIFYFRATKFNDYNSWWPETLLYVDRHGGPFEMFARAKSARYFERIKHLVGVKNVQELSAYISGLLADANSIPRWQFDRLNIKRLMASDNIASTP
ncbi:TIR domain-containing protein [Rhizobium leguminosarum]|uniref:SEFIR domain-containing protein n=1 Tax=Rhizobium leguminosarum TaxID=384 RepID=UPI0014426D1C|nr:SEFIR domain-containing protein [Rhizobium leguminosarum]MBY5836347.1 TIR domain-containing protein [Rhizobium leguminosarum]NKM78962.1 TIR domain-containing protein [Rhizobium leguminosarum bv. viciae]QSZ08662.1 TIR domain-containing protein [Rhizobium leguminosarum]